MSDAITVTDYFGGCPHCGANHGFLNVRAEHWIVCDAHQVKWCVGSNLFSSWKDENERIWRRNTERLLGYSKVEPLPEGTWSSDAAARERQLESRRSILNGASAEQVAGAAHSPAAASNSAAPGRSGNRAAGLS